MKKPNRGPLSLDKRPRTYTGLRYDPLYFTEGDVRLDDIAKALSQICRYNGAINFHYSVAQHSVLLAHVVPYFMNARGLFHKEDLEYQYHAHACAALMHDASETYLTDYISPVKMDMAIAGVPVRDAEHKIQVSIFSKYGLDIGLLPAVEEYDHRITENEKDVLFFDRASAPKKFERLDGVDITKWTPEFAYEKFMQTAHDLGIDDTHGLPH